jgi:Patatin-like phospholipase
MSEKSEHTFEIGLALAGAISAGAYTAGVLDFLFQALGEWEKERGKQGVPDHRVVLKVVAGASAGAITGALGAVALARGFQPTPFTPEEAANSYREPGLKYQTLRCVLPSLYDTWVTHPRLVSDNGGIDFLSGEDLEADRGQSSVLSLLNAKLLDKIKDQALRAGSSAARVSQPPYSYLAEPLHVYMTVSNLRGIPFRVGFGNSTYGMQTHGDRMHYALSGLGGYQGQDSDWLKADKKLELAVASLPNGDGQPLSPEWDDYGTCALASSAFPVGLASRQISTSIDQYHGRQYPLPVPPGVGINPNFPTPWPPEQPFIFLNVDGGLINNNPFDYAQFALMGQASAPESAGSAANRAVIMIAPFPEPPAFLPEGQPGQELASVVRALFPTLVNQARFRASELAPALASYDYSRFLVAPHRKLPGDDKEQRYTIACGLLGGFGGFLDEAFRAHDFQLGRRNCQAFLRWTFGLPADNPISIPIKDRPDSYIPADERNQLPERYAIIPLVGSAADEVPLPRWPRIGQPELKEILRRITARFKAVAPRLVRAQTASPLLRLIAGIGLRLGQDRLLQYVHWAILSDLIRRDQIAGWELPRELQDWVQQYPANLDGRTNTAGDVRAVLAELASPAFDFRTVDGVAQKAHLDPNFVARLLAQLRPIGLEKPYSVWSWRDKMGEELVTLASRRPKGFRALPVVSGFGRWLEPPATDQDSAGKSFGM